MSDTTSFDVEVSDLIDATRWRVYEAFTDQMSLPDSSRGAAR